MDTFTLRLFRKLFTKKETHKIEETKEIPLTSKIELQLIFSYYNYSIFIDSIKDGIICFRGLCYLDSMNGFYSAKLEDFTEALINSAICNNINANFQINPDMVPYL